MIHILRTIVIIDAVSVAAVAIGAGIGALFGMTPFQTLGAGVVGFAAIGLLLGWRAIVNAPPRKREPREEWTHQPAQLPQPQAWLIVYEPQPPQIDAPAAPLMIEAAGRELIP